MANFIVIVDPDPARRTSYCRSIRSQIAPVEGLIVGECSSHNFHAIWACNPTAPISHVADQNGAAVIWGITMDENSRRLDAAGLRTAWRDLPERNPVAFDGYHAAVSYSRMTGLVVGADLLGMFPVYWWSVDDVLLVGSSPELFRHHPRFKFRLDIAGLTGILLTMHLLDGRTLLQGVHRLDAGNLLVAQPRKPVKEVKQYRIPVSMDYFEYSYTGQLNILHEALDEAVRRHAPKGENHGLLLSGGLDSRTLGGYLKRNDIPTIALTSGLPTDIETKCARQVARALGLEHRIVHIKLEDYPGYMLLQSHWEHGANGFNTIMSWGFYRYLRNLAPKIVTGYGMDCVLGGPLIQHQFPSPGPFAKVFPYYNRCGVPLQVLEKLLRPEVFGPAVQDTIDRLRETYQGYSTLESQREWCFELHHRQRFHVGGMAWRLTFGAWPVMPAIDRKVLAVAGGMPASTVGERRAQQDLLCRYFPLLAEIPLDRNSFVTTPLKPRLRWIIAQYAGASAKRLLQPFRKLHHGQAERRIYFREYDINGPGWQAVRELVQPCRGKVRDLFDTEMLNQILPPPETHLRVKDGIIDVSGMKSLLGFLLWAKEYL